MEKVEFHTARTGANCLVTETRVSMVVWGKAVAEAGNPEKRLPLTAETPHLGSIQARLHISRIRSMVGYSMVSIHWLWQGNLGVFIKRTGIISKLRTRFAN